MASRNIPTTANTCDASIASTESNSRSLLEYKRSEIERKFPDRHEKTQHIHAAFELSGLEPEPGFSP